MIVCGVDPGLGGALAFIDSHGNVAIEDMPVIAVASGAVRRRVDGRALADMLLKLCPATEPATVFCEDVTVAMGGQGSSAMTGLSLGRSISAIEIATDILRMPLRLVPPKEWQSFFGLKGKTKENKSRGKGELTKATLLARRLYPKAIPLLERVGDADRAEALLLAHYGWRCLR